MADTTTAQYPETRAVLRYSHVSPTKVRQVLGLIRGIDVDEARDRLRFCERGPAEPVRKLLDSAVANAEHNNDLPPDELYVVRAWADEGPDAEAPAAARPWPRRPHPQAHQSRDDRRRPLHRRAARAASPS